MAQLAWLWTNRRARLFELDEAGYTAMAARLARQRSVDGVWSTLHEGNHGPLQAIMAVPLLLLRGRDPAVLLLENVVFGAATAVLTFVLARRLGDRRTGLVAAVLVLLSPGVIELSHLALTVAPATLFATLAMMAVVEGAGLERRRWAVVAGIAVGCMTLSRSMTVGFVPAFIVAAGGWAWARRTPLATVARNGALAVLSGLVVAAWWWIIRWDDVSTYLFGGGSSDTTQYTNPPVKLAIHLGELAFLYLGAITTVVAIGAYVLLRWRTKRLAREPTAPPSHPVDGVLALWPLWSATAMVLAVLSVTGAFGVGFLLPILPWVVATAVVAIHRSLGPAVASRWVAVVVPVALVVAVTSVDPGLRADVWCSGDDDRTQCSVTDDAEAAGWSAAIGELADRLVTAQQITQPDGGPTALDSRDLLVNANTLGLAAELRHEAGIDWGPFFDPSMSAAAQIDEVLGSASLVVAVPDHSDDLVLGRDQPAPERLVTEARGAGFVPCDEVELPDGRTITVLSAPGVPPAACA